MFFPSEGAINVTHRKSACPKVMGEGSPAHFVFYFLAVDRSCQVADSRIHSTCGLARAGVLVHKVQVCPLCLDFPQVLADLVRMAQFSLKHKACIFYCLLQRHMVEKSNPLPQLSLDN